MTRAVTFAVPGDLSTPTGGYAYDRRMVEGLRALGWQVTVVDLGEGFPLVNDDMRQRAEARLRETPEGGTIVVDGLALGVLPAAADRVSGDRRLIALVHHPLAYESGLSESQRLALRASEKEALRHVAGVIVPSAATRDLLVGQYGVAGGKMHIVRPGQDRIAPVERRSQATVSLLTVAAVVPRKGYDVLIAALAMLKDLPWTLTVAGDRTRDVRTAENLDADIARHGLRDRIALLGAVSDRQLSDLYANADLFVLASRFEGYGMAYADAIAHGVPVVGTRAGAIAEAVPAEAGILVPPDDVPALTAALRRLIEDAGERERLAAQARRAASTLPTWPQQAAAFARAIEAIA